MTQTRIYSVLILAGCLPFIGGAMAPYFGLMELPIIGDIQRATAFYALAIVSFMAGTQWGISLRPNYDDQPTHRSQMCPKRSMLVSNVFVLIPWLMLSIFGVSIGYYFSVAVVFVMIVLGDYRLMNRDLITTDYYRMRLLATAVVVVCLVSLAFTAM